MSLRARLVRLLMHRTELPAVTPVEEHEAAEEQLRQVRRKLADSEARARAIEVQADLAARRRPARRPEPGKG